MTWKLKKSDIAYEMYLKWWNCRGRGCRVGGKSRQRSGAAAWDPETYWRTRLLEGSAWRSSYQSNKECPPQFVRALMNMYLPKQDPPNQKTVEVLNLHGCTVPSWAAKATWQPPERQKWMNQWKEDGLSRSVWDQKGYCPIRTIRNTE